MSKVVIYHNPRCSKSRGALQILQEKLSEAQIEQIRYMESAPSKEHLEEICGMLDCKPLEIIRTGEKLFKELGLNKNDERSDSEWLQIMADHPRLIERPIIVYQNRAVVGRPPEKVLELIG